MNNKYILNKNIKLRGWKLLPYALVIAPDNNVEFIDKDTFDIKAFSELGSWEIDD